MSDINDMETTKKRLLCNEILKVKGNKFRFSRKGKFAPLGRSVWPGKYSNFLESRTCYANKEDLNYDLQDYSTKEGSTLSDTQNLTNLINAHVNSVYRYPGRATGISTFKSGACDKLCNRECEPGELVSGCTPPLGKGDDRWNNCFKKSRDHKTNEET